MKKWVLLLAFAAFAVLFLVAVSDLDEYQDDEFREWCVNVLAPDLINDFSSLSSCLETSDYDNAVVWAEIIEEDCRDYLSKIDTFVLSSDLEKVRMEVRSALHDFETGAAYAKVGISEMDTDYLYEAIDLFDSGTEHIDNAIDFIQG